jgi:amino acid adenylation domain-containing protein
MAHRPEPTGEPTGVRVRLPTWTAPNATGTGTFGCAVPLPEPGTLHAVARRCGVDVRTVLLAAHAAVLAALTAEPTGHTWRELLAAAGTRTDPGADLTVHIAMDRDPTMVLRGRSDVLTADHLARIAGYHAVALRAIAEDPDAPADECELLSPHEISHQVHGLAGPCPALDGRSFAELFAERARVVPDRPAASHRGRSWTYRELDANANRIARELRGRGLVAEDVVAVVLERDLDWLAVMIGVLRAGGVYLPVPPGLPLVRASAQLRAGGCRFALTSPAAAPALRAALAGAGRECAVLFAADVLAGNGDVTDPGVVVGRDQAAYLYFTSGSTGAPKGVLCEHAGMVNHLLMKIEDLELSEVDVVAQTAPQWLDISLWQSLAALLVGGRVHVVDGGVLLDVDRFLDELAAAGVRVAQIVPSYFEVLVSRLTRTGRGVGGLRLVSVTGEALKLDLARRWFACCPDVPLVNAYGATELCDDTMHEILTGPPDRPFVSVGRPGRNVRAYVLDERHRLAPLGSPGEIAFAGVCVGRGYVREEDGTRQVFRPDPYRPGERMYLTGDYGRWLPEGRIEFLGRRDQQVRIRGLRVEIGEVENGLLGLPGIRDAAVVVDGGEDRDRILVAFLVGTEPLASTSVAEGMAELLPDYLVPTYFHQLDALPLNENGKVDRRALTRLADTLGHAGSAHVAPRTVTERTLAQAWAEVLDVPLERIGRLDHFFQLGGTSLTAAWLMVALDGLVSLRDVVARPVLADLAAALDGPAPSPARLLQPLAPQPSLPSAALVCLPYAGGNAVNFQVLAQCLAPAGLAVHGVELPGHDLSDGRVAPASVGQVARALADEVERLGPVPVALWGHGTGAAVALALAGELAGRPVELVRVFLGAALPDAWGEDAVAALTDEQVIARLLAEGAYVEFDGLRRRRGELVAAAYRHDVRVAAAFLADARRDPARHRVATPVEVVVAADDPATVGYRERYRDWAALADDVVLRELSDGGHYFPRTRPDDVAALVAAACGRSAHAGR